ncbi:MAG TPA: pilin [Candidatus Bathyarchaeia archaeon]|nr:pilin [Candidatus Bathyarchaeia archaeon]
MEGWTQDDKGVATFKSLEFVFRRILNIAFTLAGVVLFVMLLVGGFGYLTSSGDPDKAKKAGATITSAIVGFVLLILSWFILRLLSQFTGVDLTKFEIPGL